MLITNATNFRKNIYGYLDSIIELNDEVTITTKNGNAVLISADELSGLRETAYLNSIPGMAEKILTGRNDPNEETFEVDWKNEL